MINKLETLPNERINFLIFLILTKDKRGIIFTQTDLSDKNIFSEILLP